jgi:hypothetical protein
VLVLCTTSAIRMPQIYHPLLCEVSRLETALEMSITTRGVACCEHLHYELVFYGCALVFPLTEGPCLEVVGCQVRPFGVTDTSTLSFVGRNLVVQIL